MIYETFSLNLRVIRENKAPENTEKRSGYAKDAASGCTVTADLKTSSRNENAIM